MELILNTPDYMDAPFEVMSLDSLQRIVEKLPADQKIPIYCHASSQQSVDSFKWLVSESKKRGLPLTLCLSSSDTDLPIWDFLPKDFPIEVSLAQGKNHPLLHELADFETVFFFLPLENQDASCENLNKALEVYQKPLKIRFGIGWKHRLSGPAYIPTEQYQVWADEIVKLIKRISPTAIKMEFACGLKLCLFNRLQLGDLAAQPLIWPIATCQKPMVFFPDGSLRPCFRLNLPALPTITEKSNFIDIVKEFDKWSTPFSGMCYQSETFSCRSLLVSCCSTGCLEHNLSEWFSAASPEQGNTSTTAGISAKIREEG